MRGRLLQQLGKVEHLAARSKWDRLLRNPYHYLFAILYKNIIYPKVRTEIKKDAKLFFGKKMSVSLPASTDIYLMGGKSHSSEIRLAKYLILHLEQGDHFLDIGAHFGYFTLLASEIVGENGEVYAFEPSKKNMGLLTLNSHNQSNIKIFGEAVSDVRGVVSFYEFPNLYSEYNSVNIEQFETESWFSAYQPVRLDIPSTTIDIINKEHTIIPKIIKVDVEGSEFKVVKGAMNFLKNRSPTVVMEYIEPERHNVEHQSATRFLRELGYSSHIIMQNGQLESIDDIDVYLVSNGLESDNIVFQK